MRRLASRPRAYRGIGLDTAAVKPFTGKYATKNTYFPLAAQEK